MPYLCLKTENCFRCGHVTSNINRIPTFRCKASIRSKDKKHHIPGDQCPYRNILALEEEMRAHGIPVETERVG